MNELLPGTNLEVLVRLRAWFQQKLDGVIVTSYRHSLTCNERPRRVIPVAEQHRCVICDSKLFRTRLAEDVTPDWVESDTIKEVIMVQSKRYIRVYDSRGREYNVCYKISECMRRAGFTEAHKMEDVVPEPEITDLLPLEGNTDVPEALWTELVEVWTRRVRPFLIRWKDQEINKFNVVEFWSEFHKAEAAWSPFFEEGIARAKASNALLRYTGVRV